MNLDNGVAYIMQVHQYKSEGMGIILDVPSGSVHVVDDEVFEAVKEWGGQVVEIPYTQGINSSALADNASSIGTTPDVRRAALRRLIAAKPIVRIMEAHSGLSGLIIENAEVTKEDGVHRFDGMWSSSLTDSTAKGKPDTELVDNTSRLDTIEQIMEVTTKPIILDGDSGGLVEHFQYLVATLERIGVSAVDDFVKIVLHNFTSFF